VILLGHTKIENTVRYLTITATVGVVRWPLLVGAGSFRFDGNWVDW
jgi:hypothetical protein